MLGFYDPVNNLMVRDTMQAIIRNSFAPYTIIDFSKAVLVQNGKADFTFNNFSYGVPVYTQLKHRNSLETWSKTPSSGTFALLFAILNFLR